MGKRIVSMFSMLVVAIGILLSSDLVSSQVIISELDTVAVTVGYYISKSGGINDSIKSYVRKEVDANIYCTMEECTSIKKGDTYFYAIEKAYTPVLFNPNDKFIRIKRSVVIGLYS